MKTPSKNPSTSRRKSRRELLSKTLNESPTRRRRRGGEIFRFKDAKGKTVEFVEMDTADPCVEIGFADKTALIFILDTDTRLSMEPVYSDWKTGNERLIRRWPVKTSN